MRLPATVGRADRGHPIAPGAALRHDLEHDRSRERPYIPFMLKLLPFLVMLVGLLVWIRLQAALSGSGLRRQSRPLAQRNLELLVARIAHAAGVEHVRVRVLPAEIINGLATPSGEVYVTQGLVQAATSGKVTGAEFASVVAHELGHLALGHTKRRTVDVMAAQAATLVVGGLIARLIPVVGWYFARWLSSLFVATLSRKDEFEADAYATALMMRAGLGAEPQAAMLEKLPTLMPAGITADPGARESWLASHPPIAERAAAIRANGRHWSGQAARPG